MIYPPKELSISADYKEVSGFIKSKEQRKCVVYESTRTPNLQVQVTYSRAIGLRERQNAPVADNELQQQFVDNCDGLNWCIQARHLPEEMRNWAQELLAEGFDMAGVVFPATPKSQNIVGFQMIRGEKVKGAHTSYLFIWQPNGETLQELAFKWRRDDCTVVVQEVEDPAAQVVPISSDN